MIEFRSRLSGIFRRLMVGGGVVAALALLLLAGLAPAVPAAANGTGYIGLAGDSAGHIHVFDTGTNTVLGTVDLPQTILIGDCAVTADGALGFVTDFDYKLWVIDLTQSPPALAAGTNPIPVSTPGEDVAISPDGQYLVITDGYWGENIPISVVDIANRTEVDTFSVANNHCSVDVLSDGSVLVTSYDSMTAYRLTIDSTGKLTDTGETLPVDQPNNIYGAPNARSGFVVNSLSNNILSFTVPGLTPVDTRGLPGLGACGVVHPAGDKIYVRTANGFVMAYSFNSATGDLSSAPIFMIPAATCINYFGMEQMAITPDGSRLYVSEGNLLKAYDANTGALLDTISDPNFSSLTGVCLGLAPYPRVTKTAELETDLDGDGMAGPGNTLKYTVVTRVAFADASDIIFADTPNENTTLAAGSVTKTQGKVVKGNHSGDRSVEVFVGDVPAGGTATVTFKVTINSPFWEFGFANQGMVTGSNFFPVVSDDPGTTQPGDATATQVKMSPPIHGPGLSEWGIAVLVVLLGGAIIGVNRSQNSKFKRQKAKER